VTDPAPKDAEPLRFYRSFTVDSGFPGKLALTSFRYLLFNPAGLLRVIVIALALAASAFIVTVRSNGPDYPLALAGYGLAGFVLLIAVVMGIGFLIERRRFSDRIPPGSEFAVGFRADTILMRSPMDTAEVAFSQYQTVEETGDFVVLRQRASRAINFLPRECFTDESLAFLRSKIMPPTVTS
jgi:hypothetical protein